MTASRNAFLRGARCGYSARKAWAFAGLDAAFTSAQACEGFARERSAAGLGGCGRKARAITAKPLAFPIQLLENTEDDTGFRKRKGPFDGAVTMPRAWNLSKDNSRPDRQDWPAEGIARIRTTKTVRPSPIAVPLPTGLFRTDPSGLRGIAIAILKTQQIGVSVWFDARDATLKSHFAPD